MRKALIIFPLLFIAMACDDSSTAPARAAASRQTSEARSASTTPVIETAIIQGTVQFEGPAPKLAQTPGGKCHAGAAPIIEETVVADSSNFLKNVFVYLKDAPASDSSVEPLLLDQVDCRYVPHAIAIHTNQPLRIRSSENTLHNVHLQCSVNPSENFALTAAGQERTVQFKAPEIFKVSCDVHPWMSAYIGVFDHPYIAVTDEHGKFSIPKVPAGTYTLSTWHERFGEQQNQIVVGDGQTISSDFVYKAPPAQ
jgi:hypothetical protein